MRRRFVTLDVFTARRFAGNPLAVVLDPDGLDGAAMQAVAREFNLSETVFVLPPERAAHRAKLRIFTPGAELPFAGHPTVGTAVLLARLDGGAAREFVLEEGVGPVPCWAEAGGDGGSARFSLPRLPARAGAIASNAQLAAALGLNAHEIGAPPFVPESWTAGNAFAFVPVRGLDAIRRCRPDLGKWDDAFVPGEPGMAFVFCRETSARGHHIHARMFAPRQGILEDPATGSAAAAFAGLAVERLGLADGEHAFAIEQGYEMGRPSLIRLHLTVSAGKLAAASIGGEAVVVSEGTIEA